MKANVKVLLFSLLLLSCSKQNPQQQPVCEPSLDNIEEGWVAISPGTFVFGTAPGTPCFYPKEEKQVEVTLTHPFVMAPTEVTQAQWEAACLPNPSKSTGANKPVQFVNWYEALAYCNALSRAAGLEECYDLSSCTGVLGGGCPATCPETCFYREDCDGHSSNCIEDAYVCSGEVHKYDSFYDCPGYRLPTTAEWEWAARSGTDTHNYNGDVTTDSDGDCQIDEVVEPIAWYCGNSGGTIHDVGQKTPSPWGLYDIYGNVTEWVDYEFCGLGLEAAEGEDGPLTDPVGGVVVSADAHDTRGGSFFLWACKCRANSQWAMGSDKRSMDFGLRPVRTVFE